MEESIHKSGGSFLSELPYLNMGASFLVGLSVGYVLKKSFKLMLFILGLSLILIFFLEYKNIIVVNENELLSMADSIEKYFIAFVSFLKDRISRIKIYGTLSAVAGFIVGIKMG
jgi:uncharacterized membrane protein (Fun14 family)